MMRFAEGEARRQATRLPDCLESYDTDDSLVRVIEVFIDELDWVAVGANARPTSTSA